MNVNIHFTTDDDAFELGRFVVGVDDVLKQVDKALRDSSNETTIVRPIKNLKRNRRIGTISITHDTPINEL